MALDESKIKEKAMVEKLGDVYELEADHLELKQLGSAVSNCKRIRKLDVSFNSITRITEIPRLRELREINISSNCLSKFPDFSACTQLEAISLAYNKISSIRGISSLRRLKRLQLQGNSISCIKHGQIPVSVSVLDLTGNPLKDVHGICSLNNLINLSLGRSNLTANTLQDLRLERCAQLTELDIAYNEVDDLSALSACETLKVLHAESNLLASCADFPSHPTLEELYVARNAITNLNNLCKKLPMLQVLDMEANRLPVDLLPSVAEELAGLACLEQLLLKGNPIAASSEYRRTVLACVPSLLSLDAVKLSQDTGKRPGSARTRPFRRSLTRQRGVVTSSSLHKLCEQLDGTLEEHKQRFVDVIRRSHARVQSAGLRSSLSGASPSPAHARPYVPSPPSALKGAPRFRRPSTPSFLGRSPRAQRVQEPLTRGSGGVAPAIRRGRTRPHTAFTRSGKMTDALLQALARKAALHSPGPSAEDVPALAPHKSDALDVRRTLQELGAAAPAPPGARGFLLPQEYPKPQDLSQPLAELLDAGPAGSSGAVAAPSAGPIDSRRTDSSELRRRLTQRMQLPATALVRPASASGVRRGSGSGRSHTSTLRLVQGTVATQSSGSPARARVSQTSAAVTPKGTKVTTEDSNGVAQQAPSAAAADRLARHLRVNLNRKPSRRSRRRNL